MGLGIDVGIDPNGDTGLLAEPSGNPVDGLQFLRRFDVEHQDVGVEGRFDFRLGLADTGIDDFLRIATDLLGAKQFPSGNHVKTRTESDEGFEHR